MEEVRITNAVPGDAWGIVNVLHKTWLATYPNEEFGITKEHIEESYKDSFTEEKLKKLNNKLAQTSEEERRLIARTESGIVGVATMIKNKENNQLKTLYVLPEFQGKGIGKKLWEEAKTFCDPTKDSIVQVATYNLNAIEFYKRLGFVDTGKRSISTAWRVEKIGAHIPEMEMVINAGQK